MAAVRFIADERGASEMVAASLTITLAVVAGVGMIGVGSVVVQLDHHASMAPVMEEDSQRLSAAIESVDRLVRQSETTRRISQQVQLPARIEGASYQIRVLNSSAAASNEACGPVADTPDTGCLLFTVPEAGSNSPFPVVGYFTTGPNVTVASTTLQGGPILVVRKQGAGSTIVLEEAES